MSVPWLHPHECHHLLWTFPTECCLQMLPPPMSVTCTPTPMSVSNPHGWYPRLPRECLPQTDVSSHPTPLKFLDFVPKHLAAIICNKGAPFCLLCPPLLPVGSQLPHPKTQRRPGGRLVWPMGWWGCVVVAVVRSVYLCTVVQCCISVVQEVIQNVRCHVVSWDQQSKDRKIGSETRFLTFQHVSRLVYKCVSSDQQLRNLWLKTKHPKTFRKKDVACVWMRFAPSQNRDHSHNDLQKYSSLLQISPKIVS